MEERPVSSNHQDITLLLQRVSRGDAGATDELVAVAYPELRRIAAQRLRRERPDHTLQPTALVNEVFVRLLGEQAAISWQNRAHFFAVMSQKMRFLLVDHARHKHRGDHVSVTLDDVTGPEALGISVQTDENLVALDEALSRLQEIDPRAAQAVELRFFGGLTIKETAEVLNVDAATVKRDWVFAKSYLYDQLNG